MKEVIVDLGCGRKKRTKGGKLVEDLKEGLREMRKKALGRAPTKEELDKAWKEFSLRNVIGIDSRKKFQPDIVCQLGYEKIPLEDESVDYVLAHDFLEHLPFVDGDRRPVQFLFDEVFRILKAGGYFEVKIPAFPYDWVGYFQPSHKSYWGPQTIDYFGRRFIICSKHVSSADRKFSALLLKYEQE